MSSRVDFYLLDQTETSQIANYVCRLVNKAYEEGMRIYVLSATPVQSVELDKKMWTISDATFLPHALAGSPQSTSGLTKICIGDVLPEQSGKATEEDGHSEYDLLVNLSHGDQVEGVIFARVVEIVTADEKHKATARMRYSQWREQGAELKLHHIRL